MKVKWMERCYDENIFAVYVTDACIAVESTNSI